MDGDFSFMDKWLAEQSAFTAYDEIPYDQLLGRDSLKAYVEEEKFASPKCSI